MTKSQKHNSQRLHLNKRRLKSQKIVSKQKEALKIERRLNELYELKYKTPLVKLDRPIRDGYVKYYVVREDFDRSNKGPMLREILKVINKSVYSQSPEFKVKRRRKGQKTVIIHRLRHIGQREWEKLKWPEHYKRYFALQTKIIEKQYIFNNGDILTISNHVKGYFFQFDYMFEAKVEPHYITHVQPINPELESEIQYLRHKLERDDLYRVLDRMRGNRRREHWDRGASPAQLKLEAAKVADEEFLSQID